ncbi:Utp14-domain-containing protein [Coprinopsis marcescibilis]|uniref:Utp14-domain-containing protein n=1 Tax=Coprinopsis marcescibilis TaxID=230819 RepID=A0A5C3KZD7_COPMA|nr:Utp14-domain-containing protein [Coprinopsis marcescibilis]
MANAKPRQTGFPKKKSGQNGGKRTLLNTKANAAAAGYAKRHSAKDKKRQGTSDIYEYAPEKSRRSKVTLDLTREEALEFGTLDELDDDQRELLKARLIGENDDDEKVDSDDDEEVDSDAAFEDSDEERFAEFFPNKKKKASSKAKDRSVRFADVDLNEDEEPEAAKEDGTADEDDDEEEEGDADEFLDLLDVLDGKGEIYNPSDDESAPKETARAGKPKSDQDSDVEVDSEAEESGEEVDDEESGEDDEDDETAMQITASDDEIDVEDSNLDRLQSFIEGLETTAQKRKAVDDGQPTQKRKRRTIQEKNETGAEDEFRVDASGSRLNLDDFLAPLASQSSALMSLKRTAKVLGSSSKTKTLAAPLPQRAQEKLDREAAYEKTKEEAEHLSFPLQSEKPGRVSNMELNAKFKPTTQLESAVDRLLKSAKVREEDLHETEEGMLKANNLSVEEIAERRAELRKMRELMYRAEIKAKRVKKIKSKTYRKLRRKEKERMAEKIDDEEDSDDEEAQMKKEVERARERATLRHKHTGKWAKQMRSKHVDEDQMKEIEDMLDKGEKLRRKVQGMGSDESGDEESSDDDDDLSPEEALAKFKADTFDELQKLKDSGEAESGATGKKGNSIFEMKFMKDAMARQNASANREVDDFAQVLAGHMNVDGDETDDGANEEQGPSNGVVVKRVGGRTVYRPGSLAADNNTHPTLQTQPLPPPSDTSSVTLRSTDLFSPAPNSPLIPTHVAASATVNPWLAHGEAAESLKVGRKKNEVVVSKDSKAADKSKNKLRKNARKHEEEKQLEKDDAILEISADNVLQLSTESSTSKASSSQKKDTGVVSADNDDDSDSNSEADAQEQGLLRKMKGKGKAAAQTAFQQRDLVALAFAGDNVVRQFEETKRREIESDAPKEIDTTIPGWGSWGGSGMKRKPPKPERIKKIAGVDPTTRADYNKKHIIISEKRDKKASKYLVKDLPYPYTSQAQFERAMDRPLGPQWNTRVAFQRATLPRVVKKPGVVIAALEKQTT